MEQHHRQSDSQLQLEIACEEEFIKNQLLKELVTKYMNISLTQELTIRVLEDKINQFMEREDRYKTMSGKIINNE